MITRTLDHSTTSIRVAVWGSRISAGAPALFSAIALVATGTATGYSSLGSAISELATPAHPFPWIINVGFIAYGLMVQGLGLGLRLWATTSLARSVLWPLVVLYGFGAVLAGLFVTGSPDVRFSVVTDSQLHGVGAWVTLTAIMALMLTVARSRAEADRNRLRKASWVLLGLTTLAVLAFLLVPTDLGLRGLFQRTFFATTMAWVFLTSIGIRRWLGEQSKRTQS